jgi:hypothetical protein
LTANLHVSRCLLVKHFAKATRTFRVLSQPVRNNETARSAAYNHIVVKRPQLRGIIDYNRARSERRGR